MTNLSSPTFLKILAALSLVLATACSGGADDAPAMLEDSSDGRTNTANQATGCTEGYVRECSIELPSQNGVKNCVTGLQACSGSKWGACQDPADMDASQLAQVNLAK